MPDLIVTIKLLHLAAFTITFRMNTTFKTILAVATMAAIFACSGKEGPEKKPVPGQISITNVRIDGVYATADVESSTITATFPTRTDFSSCEMTIESQTVTLDLSTPATYRVIRDNIYQDYSVIARNTGLPVVRIQTPGGKNIAVGENGNRDYYKDNWMEGATMRIELPDGTVDYEGQMGIRGRGNSTWNYPKKPYALKLDSKAEILGMPKHKRWILLANWKDRTILRNDAAFWLSRTIGLPYTVRGQFVELVMNGTHAGNYYLCEQIKIDKNRVNIDKDGGFLLEVDSYYDEPNKFRYTQLLNLPWMVKEPDGGELNLDYYKELQDFIFNLETLMKSESRVRNHEYADYLDVQTAIDFLIMQELTGNHDFYNTWPSAGPHSLYMYKPAGGKLYSGPAWDFDFHVFLPERANFWCGATQTMFYPYLLKDPDFKAALVARWNEKKDELKKLPEYIDSMADSIRLSESFNSTLWPISNRENGDEEMTFQQSVERIKKAFLDKWEWIDNNISRL